MNDDTFEAPHRIWPEDGRLDDVAAALLRLASLDLGLPRDHADDRSLLEQVVGHVNILTNELGNFIQGQHELERELEARVRERTREVQDREIELRAASDFLRDIYKAMPGALFVFNRDGTVETVNEAAAALLEYPVAKLRGAHVASIFEPSDIPQFSEIEALAARGAVMRCEKALRTRSGQRIPVLFSATLLTRGSTSPSSDGAVCIALDIRERIRLEMELSQAQKLESIGRLAAGIAHEINTPIQFVNDSVQFLGEAITDIVDVIGKYKQVNQSVIAGAPSLEAAEQATGAETDLDIAYLLEQVPEAIDRAGEGLRRVASIVRSMKEFAHPGFGAMTEVDLNQTIRSTLTIAHHEYKYVAKMHTAFGDLPPILCHPGEVNQAILNIVVNAAHAIADVTDATGVLGEITIHTRREGGFAVIEIGDTAGGIPENIRGRIFEPFFTTKGVGKGTGQGLAIARSVVVDKHGGSLTFHSETGKGTTFFISLPIDGNISAR